MDDSSSDSDAGERLKNLKLVVIRSQSQDIDTDEKYVHKRKLGDLIFDANFEAGNLCNVKRINSFEYELMVRPDIANPAHHSWFNFTICNQQENQCVVFTFVNLNPRELGLFHHGLTPVVRSRSSPNWVRLHRDQVFYYSGGNSVSDNGLILSIAFRFKAMEDKHQFALFYPYSHSTLIHFLNRWDVELERKKRRMLQDRPELKVTKIGMSFTFKPIHLIELGSEDGLNETRPLVVVVCRRCGNMNSNISLVCQGMMDFLLGYNHVARAALKLIKFAFLPLVEPDSVCAGNSGTDLLGRSEITRDLLAANQLVYANLIKVQELIKGWCSGSAKPQVVLLELGVNHGIIGSRLLGSYYENSFRMEAHLSLARALSLFVEGFQVENCLFRNEPRTFSGPFDGSSNGRHNVNHYLFEISSFAHYKRSPSSRQGTNHRAGYEEYDQVKYLSVGVALVYSLLDVLRTCCEKGSSTNARVLDAGTRAHLDSFHLNNKDIDDLLLIRQTCGASR